MQKVVTRGLLIKSPWIEKILERNKTWEIRSRKTTKVGERIALIKSGTKKIYGTCIIKDRKGPLTLKMIRDNAEKHLIEKKEWPNVAGTVKYAWIIAGVNKLTTPRPIRQPKGVVTRVKILKSVSGKL